MIFFTGYTLPGLVIGSEIYVRKRTKLLLQRRTKLKLASLKRKWKLSPAYFHSACIKCLYFSLMPGKKSLGSSSMPVWLLYWLYIGYRWSYTMKPLKTWNDQSLFPLRRFIKIHQDYRLTTFLIKFQNVYENLTLMY